MANDDLSASAVGMATTPDGNGYWLADADGDVLAFGDATSHGQASGIHLASPIVGIAATPDGGGYWLVAADGGIFTFGDAGFHGSTGGRQLRGRIVGIVSTPDGTGYWEVGADGSVFGFGDAQDHGSIGGRSASPIVGMAATADGGGYWLAAADGGVFTFGDAPFLGSAAGTPLAAPIVAIAATPTGGGYRLLGGDGGVFGFGDARFGGSPPTVSIRSPVANATFSPRQRVASSFTCAAGTDGSAVRSCADQAGEPSASPVDTSTLGTHIYTVVATAHNGQQTARSVTYTVADPPSITIASPAAGATYTQGQPVVSRFSCVRGSDGSAVSTCQDQGGAATGAPIDTSAIGPHTFIATAVATDGLRSTRAVSYNVTAPPPPIAPPASVAASQPPTAAASVSAGRAGLTYVLSAARSSGHGAPIDAYRWTLDGRVIGSHATITHTFPRSGRYTVRLTVTTSAGLSATAPIAVHAHARTVTARLTVHFAFDRAGLNRADRRALTRLRPVFAAATRARITGYCAVGSPTPRAKLLRLARRRARTVARFLGHRHRPRHLTVTGRGANAFVATNRTARGRAANRRATVTLVYAKPLG